jgi:hypothetical protein
MSRSRHFSPLLDLGPDVARRAAITDKDCDEKPDRNAARKRGIRPTIPHHSTTKDKQQRFAKVSVPGAKWKVKRGCRLSHRMTLECLWVA